MARLRARRSSPTEYEDAEGIYQHAEKEVTIQLRDGSLRDMKAVLRAVLEMWVGEFKSRGLLVLLELPEPTARVISTRATANGAASMHLVARQGLRFTPSFRRQRFNYATGEVEPIDISGHKYQFSVYKCLDVQIVMTHNETGSRMAGTVQLSAEDTMHYRALKTDEERKAFEATLAPKYARRLSAKAQENETKSS
jgi:uncharacterized protein YunC (DUF1805 family)